ncbi:hypothetical protein [Pseudomonas sp. zfem002]|uniref:hypothetical protein n=1 Tax=Pseudomonas sp. zfem002 TaxID=3078197 RepID=UPI0029293A8B|nr:hypothetical protein [Pseudomonas sp. zfem002]MDU9393621.1 hypothetical protein [Pseudomonas sp. zfem002]
MTVVVAFLALLSVFVSFGIDIYTIRKDLDVILRCFQKSQAFDRYESLANIDRFAAKKYLSIYLSSVVVWPEPHIRRGMLDPQELDSLPEEIKRRVSFSTGLLGGGLCLAALFCFDTVVGDWLLDTFR